VNSSTSSETDLPGFRETQVFVRRISYHGWSDCYLIANGSVEAVVVPSIGRVMQLRLAGDAAGTFWENRALDGRAHNLPSGVWLNFGGDKCWPAPQTAWAKQQGRSWPPPFAFDSRPMEAIAGNDGVVLTSEVDTGFGIQVVRHVRLDANRPVMRIKTEFRKLSGRAITVGIWTITQMQEPKRMIMFLPAKSRFASGYVQLRETEPANLKIVNRVLSVVRHSHEYVKIGSDASSMLWGGGENCVVRIDAEQGSGKYPDGGCATEIYTNPDPLKYVEL
jgi:hypothetical protein